MSTQNSNLDPNFPKMGGFSPKFYIFGQKEVNFPYFFLINYYVVSTILLVNKDY